MIHSSFQVLNELNVNVPLLHFINTCGIVKTIEMFTTEIPSKFNFILFLL